MSHPPDSLFMEFQAAVAGRYSLERELGRGGMGVVYLAREVRLDRSVAVKLLPPGKAADAALRERFLREARTAAKLSHPNIIPIHAVDEVGDFVFFAMAFIEGETLTERLRARGPLTPTDAARLLREVAWALGYAHERGVVHRDVKPDNILLEAGSGRALVADFGIAAAISGAASLSGAEVVGTPEFMSPEQALGEAVDARSDLYALGIVGYLALSGRLPFEAERATEVLAKQVTAVPPGLATVVAGVPRRLAQSIDRCLAKDPAERPQSGPQFADQLGQLLEHRRELPLPLRVFVRRDARLDDPTVLVYPFVLLGGAVLAGVFLGAGAAVGALVLGLTFAPLSVLMTRARRLLRAGYDHGDLTLAFKVAMEQDLEERAYTSGLKSASLLEKVLRWVGLAGLGTVLLSIPTFFVDPWSAAWMYFVGMSSAVFSGIPSLVMMQRRRDVDLAVYARLWKGRIGRWLFRWAKAWLPARALPASLTHRPTELALGMAAEKLFEDLPKETRRSLRDLPDVVHRLETDAQRMRARLEKLNDALGDVKAGNGGGGTASDEQGIVTRHDRVVADLRVERDLVQQRMADAVAALETIRLNLLRLHAGSGSVQSVTTDLGLAKEVAAEVDRLLQGQREIEEML